LPNCHNNSWRNNNYYYNKSNEKIKKTNRGNDIDEDEQEHENNVDERKLPATIQNNN